MGTVVRVQPQAPPPEPAPADERGVSRWVYAFVERFAIPIAWLVTVVAFLRYATYATRRLWFDEIYTFTVALQPKWIDVWNAFCAAVDMQPPLFSFTTRISWMLLGRNELALRMPETAGVILFSWCILIFVGKRLGYVFGLCAMILTLGNGLEVFAAEARPYGMLLGACGLALLAWRNAIENPKRQVALPLFAASLALVVATHAYAIVAVAMFGIAEVARLIRTRRADFWLWACFLATLPPLTLYWFPFHAVKAMKGGEVGPGKTVHLSHIEGFYKAFFSDRLLAVYLVCALLVGLALLRKDWTRRREQTSMPFHEVALTAALAFSPFFCVVMAMFVTKFYQPRYTVYAVGGVVMLVIVLMDAVAPSRRVASLMLLSIAFFLFGLQQFCLAFDRNEVKKRDVGLEVPFALVPPNVPVVIASGLAMLPTDMYASDADVARSYYLQDRKECIRYTGSTFFEFGPPLTDFYHFRMHLVSYESFVREHKKFYAYGPYYYQDDWQIQKLKDDGAKFVEKGKYTGESSDNVLLEVEMP